MMNEKGGIDGRKIRFIILDNGSARPRRSRCRASWSRRTVCWPRSAPSARRRTRRSRNTSTARRCRRSWSRPAAASSATQGVSLDVPCYLGRGPGDRLRQVRAEDQPDAKIAVLYQNDDYGKDFLKGLKQGLGDKAAKMIVAEATYEVTDPTVDSQIW